MVTTSMEYTWYLQTFITLGYASNKVNIIVQALHRAERILTLNLVLFIFNVLYLYIAIGSLSL